MILSDLTSRTWASDMWQAKNAHAQSELASQGPLGGLQGEVSSHRGADCNSDVSFLSHALLLFVSSPSPPPTRPRQTHPRGDGGECLTSHKVVTVPTRNRPASSDPGPDPSAPRSREYQINGCTRLPGVPGSWVCLDCPRHSCPSDERPECQDPQES